MKFDYKFKIFAGILILANLIYLKLSIDMRNEVLKIKNTKYNNSNTNKTSKESQELNLNVKQKLVESKGDILSKLIYNFKI
jgi:hypothetical protein